MRTVKFEEAINNFESMLDSISGDSEGVVISRSGGEDVVVMSLSQYNGIMETLHLLEKSTNAVRLMKSVGQFKKGQTVATKTTDWDEFFDSESAFGEDFLEDRDELVPQERDFS